MPKANPIKRSFSSGQITPLVYGRTDTPAYVNGAEEITNFIVKKQGALTRRPGTEYIGETKYPNYPVRLKAFQWSTDDAYVLEFGIGYLRIWRNDTLLYGGSPKAVSTITQAGFGIQITTTNAHNFTTGDTVQVADVQGTTSANGTWTVTVVDSVSFTLDGSTFNAAYTAGGVCSGSAIELTTPYSSDHLQELEFAQSADVMWVVHNGYPVHVLKRYGTITWQFSEFETVDGPYLSSDAETVTVPVTGTENYSGIVEVNTSPNRFISGNYIEVKDINGTTEANGKWRNVTTSPDKVRLENSTYTNAYTGGGVVSKKAQFRVSNLTDVATVFNAGTALTSSSSATPANGFDDSAVSGHPDGDIGWLIEVLDDYGQWQLCKITNVIDAQTCEVDVFENIIGYLDQSTETQARYAGAKAYSSGEWTSNKMSRFDNIEGAATDIKSTFSLFAESDIGKWLRPIVNAAANPGNASGNWWKLKGVQAPDDASGDPVDGTAAGRGTDYDEIIDYDGSSVLVTFQNRTKTCRVTADMTYFQATDVGRQMRLNVAGIWIYGKITSVYSSGSTNYAVLEYEGELELAEHDPLSIANNGRVTELRMGAWSEETGYPGVVAFHQGRLIFGRSKYEPQTLWMSGTNTYDNFSTSSLDGVVTDDNAITVTLASRELNNINWIESQRILMLGTSGGEWQVRSASGAGEAITPSNIQALQQSTTGSATGEISAIVGTSIIYVQREKNRIMEMAYDWEVDSWQPRELSAHAENIWTGSVQQIAYQSTRDSIVWFHDGYNVWGITYNKAPDVAAFWKVQLENQVKQTPPSILPVSIAVVSEGEDQALYIAVQDNSRGTNYILKMGTESGHVDHFVSATMVNGIVSGLGDVFADGTTVTVGLTDTQAVVSGGQVNTGFSSTNGPVEVGIPFTSTVVMIPMEGGSPFGTAHGKKGRTPKFSLRTHNTTGYKFYAISEESTDVDASSPESKLGDQSAFGVISDVPEVSEFWLKSDYQSNEKLVFDSSGARKLTLVYVTPQQHVFE